MRKIIALATAAAMLVASQTGALASDRGREVKPIGHGPVKARHVDGGKVVAGIAIGALLVGAALASRHQQTHRYQSVRNDYGHRCGLWRADCRDGDDHACYKFDTRC